METTGIFESTFKALENNLDLRAKKHNMATSNLANIDTPNYKSFNFQVEEAMGKITQQTGSVALQQTNQRHMKTSSNMAGNISLNGIMREDKDINMDKIMTDLSENSILYNASAQILSKKYAMLKSSINGG
ncbi:MAG: flagellar basal body rod protein FlgB [Desulfobacteraceae bacterium]|nr:flagellar basal body rod protein FlgB [Desulfobacteraceae bacterium]MBU4053570.1 flagellar basal body rod protein FlgB [Pseudomonadota bacterium]